MKLIEFATPNLFKLKAQNYLSGKPIDDNLVACMNLTTGEIVNIPGDVEVEVSDFKFQLTNNDH